MRHSRKRQGFGAQVKRMMRALKPMKVNFKAPSYSDAADKEYEATIKEISGQPVYERLVKTFEKTIKGDRRAIEFLLTHELSAFTTDPSNLGMEAPTSEGKTYPTVEVIKRSPSDSVWFLGGLSPTAIVHDYGELVDKEGNPIEGAIESLREQVRDLRRGKRDAEAEKKGEIGGNLAIAEDQLKELLKQARYSVDMENKIIVFLDAPQIETWQRLRPILSHDTFEISYKFTDKPAGGSMRTSHVIIRGWPAVIYLKAGRGREDFIWDEIQTRFTTISPRMNISKYEAAVMFNALRKGLPGPVFERMLDFSEYKWAERIIRTLTRKLVELKYDARKVSQELNPNMFWIPFYEEIGKEFPATEGRHMRDSKRFLTLLQMSAAIEVFNRPYLQIGNAKFIIVVREDYERATALFFGETGEEILSGIPAHIIEFFKRVPLAMHKAGETLSVSEMVKESKKIFKRAKSSNTLRRRFLPILEDAGLMSGDTDPDDKRQKVYSVLQEEIMSKDSRIYGLFGNDAYFKAAFLDKRLNDILKIFTKGEANIRDRDGAPLTAAQLWEKYFANDPGILREYISAQQKAAIEEKAPKIPAESEKPANDDISKPKQPKIEDIVGPAPSIRTVTDALSPFRGGGQVSKSKFSEITSIPKDILQGFFSELVESGAIIDRGSMIEVI